MKTQTPLGFMAIDQHGTTEHLGSVKHPRKELMGRYYTKHAQRIYRDTKDGKTKHVGWVVRGHWFTVYRVGELQAAA